MLGSEGENAGYVISLDDVSEQVRLYNEVEKLATFDALTGTYNRRVFVELSNKEIAKTNRYMKSLCLILMDVDQFKQVNDTYGHLVGDQLPLKVADICVKNVRKVDIFGRYGGDEFILLLPETGLERAQLVAERLRRKIHQIRLENTADTCLISASFGITCAEAGMITNLEELMLFADRALYVSKHHGGNSVSMARIEPDGTTNGSEN